MAKSFKRSFKTPICELRWVNLQGVDTSINKDGSQNKKVACGVVTGEVAEQIAAQIEAIWQEAKIEMGLKKNVANGNIIPKPIVDENGDMTGEYELRFKTNTYFADGKENKVPIYNAKGKEVDLGDRKIANGSQGIIHGEIGYYDVSGQKGLTLYLKAIQITKFIEYQVGVDAIDVSEQVSDGFEAFDNEIAPAL